MEHDVIIINSKGEVVRPTYYQKLQDLAKLVGSWDIKSTTIIMNKRDYDDIVKWSGKI